MADCIVAILSIGCATQRKWRQPHAPVHSLLYRQKVALAPALDYLYVQIDACCLQLFVYYDFLNDVSLLVHMLVPL